MTKGGFWTLDYGKLMNPTTAAGVHSYPEKQLVHSEKYQIYVLKEGIFKYKKYLFTYLGYDK